MTKEKTETFARLLMQIGMNLMVTKHDLADARWTIERRGFVRHMFVRHMFVRADLTNLVVGPRHDTAEVYRSSHCYTA